MQFWQAIETGQCSVTKVPFSRWDVDSVVALSLGSAASEEVRRRVCWGAFVDELELFDCGHFRISAAEAKAMDPQQRLLLEYAQLGFADAGFVSKEEVQAVAGGGADVGVFIGIAAHDASSGISTLSTSLKLSPTAQTC
eukprot:SAG31_NODE_17456_length_670_cov_0.730298_2_plen_138_part_01